MSLKYRKDVDGLRAIAVIPVVLFHVGIELFSGGYVGVDIFFVISGYLITSIIVREIEAGEFSILGFYERRIRRIFPALLVVLIAVSLLSAVLLLPSEFEQVPPTLVGTILFVSNIVFYRQSGYFDEAAETKPLLHTWSLGVEEQFYIFVPIVLILIARYAAHWRTMLFAVATVISFGLCVVLTRTHPDAAFYLIPTRAWELFIGSLLAIGLVPQITNQAIRELAAILGMAMIIIAVTMFTDATMFPGYMAALPVVGTAMVIHCGQNTLVGRLLSIGPVVYIGLISYSLYLWHWPIFVFSKIAETGWHPVILIALSIAAASLSLKFVEAPFRSKSRIPRRRIFQFWAFASGFGLLLGFFALGQNGFPQRFSEATVAFDNGKKDISPRRTDCHSDADNLEKICELGSGDAVDVAVWSDSHGVELAFALGEVATREGRSIEQISASACPPSVGFNSAIRPTCADYNARILDHLLGSADIQTVILAAYYNGPHYRKPKLFPAMERAIDKLRQAGKRVVLVGPVPSAHTNVPHRLARMAWYEPEAPVPQIDRQRFEADYQSALAFTKRLEDEGVSVVQPRDILCQRDGCKLADKGKSLYFDHHHLSLTGARLIAPPVYGALATAR